jgi:hypothetical protein
MRFEVGNEEACSTSFSDDGVYDVVGLDNVAPVHDDFRSQPAELLGNRPANTRCGTGDQCGQTIESTSCVHLLFLTTKFAASIELTPSARARRDTRVASASSCTAT